jgi:hypothetical protein
MPFIVNPDCGRGPNAILFWLLFSTFGPLAGALLMSAVVRIVRGRHPGISTPELVLVLTGLALVLAFAFEGPAIALGLWTYAPGPGSIPLGHGFQYTIPALMETALFFLALGALYTFKDDRGRRLVERKIGDLEKPRVRAVLFLALYTTFQFVAWIPGSVPVMMNAFYERPWDRLPDYVVNKMCVAPGISGTRYGPCPGSPGYRLPGRGSLPGKSP